jgi:hypothetical protein
VFLEFADKKIASKFFSRAFAMKRLTILDEDMNEMFEREMRIYLLKTEEEFSQLAFMKYSEEIKLKGQEKKNSTDCAQGSTKEQTLSKDEQVVNKSMQNQHAKSSILKEQPILS